MANSAVQELDFKNAGEMWLTEIVVYICFILIWYLTLKTLWYFCISPTSPRLKQYDSRALKPIKSKAEQSRRRKQSESPDVTNTEETLNRPRPFGSVSQRRRPKTQISKLTNEEFQLQICKIHRSLRLCFVISLICAAINVTAIMLNHSLIIAGAVHRNCVFSKLPVTALLFQRIALYLFFLFRLHFSFGSTNFGIKPILIWILMALIVLSLSGGTFYFFLIIVTASDPCASSNASQASLLAVFVDFFWNIFLSVLFLSRLGAAVKSQSKFTGSSTRNLEKAALKKARANYKYYYTMYKLTCLFLIALISTILAYVIVILTGLGAMSSVLDSSASCYLLFLSFQFNDDWFRKMFCACLRLQTCFLGAEYAREMDIHFTINAPRKPHTIGSRTWQEGSNVETTRKGTENTITNLNKIEEERELSPKNPKLNIVITHSVNGLENKSENENEPVLNKVSTIESEISVGSNDLTATLTDADGNGLNLPNTPFDEDGNGNGLNLPNTPFDEDQSGNEIDLYNNDQL